MGEGRLARRLAALLGLVAAAGAPGWAADRFGAASEAPRLVQLAQSADELPPRMRQALILGIQEELAAHGYDVGAADGVVGPRTRAAIRAYQRDAGLAVNGIPTKDLLDHLKFAQPKVSARTGTRGEQPRAPAQRGAPADLVLAVQRELQVRGYYAGALDGRIGPGTRAAVRAFQRDAGFPVTGEVDERLLAELRVVDPKISAGRRP